MSLGSSTLPPPMVPELGRPRVTEIQVRMDCNGCVQKIKKALHGINGIYDLYIDFSQQKLTIIGWADPEKIVKAIKKTRKIATICSHTEQAEPPAPPTEQAPKEGEGPPPDAPNPPPPEAPPAEAGPPAEPPKDLPPPPENPPAETTPPPMAPDNNTSQAAHNPSGPKDVGEVHVVYHHPPDHGYRYGYGHSYGGHWPKYQNHQGLPQEPPQPMYVTHSYNTYKPSPYVTEYEYVRSPPRQTNYSRMDRYSEDYHHGNTSNGNITSIFSDENPNACSIM
ncbi:Heavy metal-associated isoprenylated plant protein 26 [Morella rubra]|uniref:Heavy metal-associated isoprenylated plant protein 26 n=1 Tax=Morella rubra TaxID=262757 RepID=A0A6A1VTC0_9ROSI|nr:Heavy metal-associated isoprenylated plant protein 26 [Morella rubra]